MLSARNETYDRIVGLEVGADDYMSKPYEPRELLARVRSVLRRSKRSDAHGGHTLPDVLEVGPLTLDFVHDRATLSADGSDLMLTQAEFSVLRTIVAHRGQGCVPHRVD